MAIPVNALNVSGLAALAGNPMPQLNLKSTAIDPNGLFGANYLDASKANAQLGYNYANLAQDKQVKEFQEAQAMARLQYERQQMAQEGLLSRANQLDVAKQYGSNQMNVAQLGADVDRERMNMQGQQFGQTLDLDKQKFQSDKDYKKGMLDLSSEENQIKKMQVILEHESKLSDKHRAARANFLNMAVNNRPEDPAQAQIFDETLGSEGIKSGVFTKEEVNNLLSLPVEKRKMAMQMQMATTMASNDFNKAVGGKNTETTITDAAGNTITMGGKQQSAFQKEQGINQAKELKEISEAAKDSSNNITKYQSLINLIPKAYGGSFAEARYQLNKLFGTNSNATTATELMKPIIGDFLNKRLQEMVGQSSDRDVSVMQASIPELSKTPEGNIAIAKAAIAMETKAALKRDFSEWWAASKENTYGMNAAWERFAKEVDILAKDPKTGGIVTNEAALKTSILKKYLDPNYSMDKEAKELVKQFGKDFKNNTKINPTGRDMTIEDAKRAIINKAE